ncbi:MAG: arsenite efflux transporter metallochaperone ArsD [Desulfotignum sp.]
MNESVKELIAIGASVGAHCQPCLEYHIRAAQEIGVSENEIRQAVEIGHKVEKGAMAAMKKFCNKTLEGLSAGQSPDNGLEKQSGPGSQNQAGPKNLKIYDPALCCSSGVCGPSVDPVLAQFAGTLKQVVGRPDISVERYNLGQEPQAFVDNEQVKALLDDGGETQLPFIFIDDQLWLKGRYPSKEELAQALNIELTQVLFPESAPADDAPCCGEEGCCE